MRSSVTKWWGPAVIAFSIVAAGSSVRAADPALKCGTGKLKEAAKYGQCRAGTESKALAAGTTPDFSTCVTKLSSKWTALESKGACPSVGDFALVEKRITGHISEIATLIAGGIAPLCGIPATGQTVSFGAGDDGDLGRGLPFQYVDNGDGTITDNNTRLMWERKVAPTLDGATVPCTDATGNCSHPHYVDNQYSWTADGTTGTTFNGSVVTVFLDQLNNRCQADATVACSTNAECAGVNEVCGTSGQCDNDPSVDCDGDIDCVGHDGPCGFAGYRDWRLPNMKELLSIVDYGRHDPAITSAFNSPGCSLTCVDFKNAACGCTRLGKYWPSTTFLAVSNKMLVVDFADGNVLGSLPKSDLYHARAVRGGL